MSYLAMSEEKAQTIVYDMMFAAMVFLIIFAFSISRYNANMSELVGDEARKDIRVKAESTIGALAEGKGVPQNWHVLGESEVKQIGLAKKPLIVSEARLQRFIAIDYNSAKEIMGIQPYEFYFSLEGNSKGIQPSNASEAVKLSRTVEYDSNIVQLELTLWVRA